MNLVNTRTAEKGSTLKSIYLAALCSGVALLIILGGAEVSDSLMIRLDLEYLTKHAESIIIGRVQSIVSEWNSERTRIFTYVTISAESFLKGEFTKDVVITVLGGTVGSITLWVEDTPQFEKDEQVLVFTEGWPPGQVGVLGWRQGKYTIEDNKILELGVSLETFTSRIKEIQSNDK